MSFFKKEPSKEIQKERDNNLDVMIQRSARLEKLIKDNGSGWKEFQVLINDYIDKCLQRKRATALDTADEKTIQILKYLDHEVFILRFVLSIPDQFIGSVKAAIESRKEKDAGQAEV